MRGSRTRGIGHCALRPALHLPGFAAAARLVSVRAGRWLSREATPGFDLGGASSRCELHHLEIEQLLKEGGDVCPARFLSHVVLRRIKMATISSGFSAPSEAPKSASQQYPAPHSRGRGSATRNHRQRSHRAHPGRAQTALPRQYPLLHCHTWTHAPQPCPMLREALNRRRKLPVRHPRPRPTYHRPN